MALRYRLFNASFWEATGAYDVAFADPPDDIGRKYDGFVDRFEYGQYEAMLGDLLERMKSCAPAIWVSFNSRHLITMAKAVQSVGFKGWKFTPCVQTFTFAMHNKGHFADAQRPLWLFEDLARCHQAPKRIYVESERQRLGDKRAAPGGKMPTSHFDFPRVVGNSSQKRKWHDNQLNEGLVERCLLFSCPPGGTVLDCFAGTGTVDRVCRRLGFGCDSFEISSAYCGHILKERLDAGQNMEYPCLEGADDSKE